MISTCDRYFTAIGLGFPRGTRGEEWGEVGDRGEGEGGRKREDDRMLGKVGGSLVER